VVYIIPGVAENLVFVFNPAEDPNAIEAVMISENIRIAPREDGSAGAGSFVWLNRAVAGRKDPNALI
jgi:hypothetical protein